MVLATFPFLFFALFSSIFYSSFICSAWLSTSSGIKCSTSLFFLTRAPDHSRPDPGIEADLRSMRGWGLYWGKCASGSSGKRKAFFFSFSRYSIPAKAFWHLEWSYSVSGLTLISLTCPLLSVLYLLLTLERRLFAIVEIYLLYIIFKLVNIAKTK